MISVSVKGKRWDGGGEEEVDITAEEGHGVARLCISTVGELCPCGRCGTPRRIVLILSRKQAKILASALNLIAKVAR